MQMVSGFRRNGRNVRKGLLLVPVLSKYSLALGIQIAGRLKLTSRGGGSGISFAALTLLP